MPVFSIARIEEASELHMCESAPEAFDFDKLTRANQYAPCF